MNDLCVIQAASKRKLDAHNMSILIVGEGNIATAVQHLLETDFHLVVRVSNDVNEGLTTLPADHPVALILLLWQEESAARLPDTLVSILNMQRNPQPVVMLRSRCYIQQQDSARLWQLGIADLCFEQNLFSVEFTDAVAVALRTYHRQITLSGIPVLSNVFAQAHSMRELAHLSLLAMQERVTAIVGGGFCYRGKSADPRLMLIAGTGCHENYSCMPVENLKDATVKRMLQDALEQCSSQFADDGAAIYLLTPAGYAACMYLTLSQPLRNWEIEMLHSICHMIATAMDNLKLANLLMRTQHATITSMSALSEYRDTDTGSHIDRVSRMTTEIAQILSRKNKQIDAKFIEQVGLASTLHDTGKIAIPDNILLKPGPLDQHERKIMEQHVTLGYDVLIRAARHTDNGELLFMSAEIARYHHERFDGKGYPEGLKGNEIPLGARIVALVDVYDALTCKRPYKLAWQHDAAVNLICNEAGSHFDPEVVDAFLELDRIRRASRRIEWQESMSVSHEDLDADHQQLVEIINRLWMAESMGNRQMIEFVLDDLVNYTEFHFAREEQLMEEAGFADRQRHGEIHRNICRHLEEIRWEYFEGIRDDLRSGLLEFVTHWLNKHILEEDMQYSRHFSNTKEALTS